MRSTELMNKLSIKKYQIKDFTIAGISDLSKDIFENWIFVAIKGIKTDGNNYIEDAVKKGAKLIFTDLKDEIKIENIDIIKVENSKKILALLLKLYYSPKPDNIISVTGTNGKSSTVDFYRSIFELLGKKSASIGTIGVISNWIKFTSEDVQMTTPSISLMHNILAKMKENDINYVSLEASSHGLDQARLAEINFKAAAFTSFSIDHLDYHSSMKDYLDAKLKLFDQIAQDGVMIINNDLEIDVRKKLEEISVKKNINKLTYGKDIESDLQIISTKKSANKQIIQIKYKGNIYESEIKLIGEFQIYNLLAAIGLAIATGENFENIWQVIPEIKPANGRMERVIDHKSGRNIYIDYAHTENALELVLKDMREYSKGKLKVMFGCGGNRDKNRRSGMGKVANLLADEIFITDDNPRDEDPALIRSEIRKFCPNSIEIPDRSEAIKIAIKSLKPEDILIIAGKGHENSHTKQGVKHYFSDREEVIKVINET